MEKPQGGETEPHEHLWDEGIREAYSPESTSDRPVSVTAILENIHGVSPRVRLHDMARQGPSLPDPPGRSGSGSIQDGSRYEFLGEIAKGGVGVVYKGRDRDLGREVALKVLLPDHAGRADLVERFVEEAQVGGQLQHPGIVPVFGLELQPDGRPYFAMKLIEGMTLAACLAEREDPARDRRRFLRIFEQLCQAVAYAHTRGVVHRDLKPLNVMVGSFGEVQVVDWGMAKVLGREDHDPHANEKPERLRTVRSGSGSSGSLEGSIMGTPSYLPPEQARGEVEKTDRRCDVFALGAMLLELLTGRPPYSLDTREALKQAAKADLADAYAALDTCSDDRHLTSLCRSCLSLKRSARPSDAGVVASRITQHLVAAEERARKAEIRARESRVRAAEERRARRLTLAVTAAMSESGEHLMAAGLAPVLDLGPWSAALDCARRAEELARAGGATKDLLEKAAAHLADVEKRLQEARATAERKRRDDAQSARLQRLRMDRHSAPDLRMTHHLYAQAFRGYGIDVDKLPPSQAAEQIAGCAIASDLVTAIDEWTWIRRRIGGNGDAIAARLRVIAQAADADPTRKHVRDMSEDASTDRLREIARDGGTDGESEWLLARVLGYRGEHEAAAELLRAMQLRDPGAFWTSHQLARELTRLGRWAEGAAFYRVAAALRPDDVPVLHELGAALLEAGDGDGALEVWRHALRIEPGDVRAYHLLLDTLHKLGKLELTIAQLRKDAATDEPWPRVGLALALMVREDWETAIEVLEEAVALWPRDAGLRCHLGDAFLYSGCREDALSQFSLALEFDADCAPATEGVYSLRMAEGDHAGMETLARDLIRLDPTVALNHGKLGQALFLQGRSREAAEAFRRGLEREEDQPILHLWLARSLMCIGDNAGAIRQLLVAHDYAKLYRARDFQPSHRPEFDPVTGIRTHRIQLGMRDLEEALDSRLATAYARKGDPLSACKWLREHLKRHPDCPDNRFFLGFFLLQTGDAAAAASELRAVLEEHDVSNPFILAYTHYHLGFALLATGEAEDGRCHLLRYGERMQRYPDWTPPSSDWERDCAALESLARRLPLLMEDRSSLESAHQTFLLGCLVEATGYPLMAAECYRDAFEQDPDLKKYSINGFFPYNGVMNGAASALRAAWGVGRDSTALDDAERARWRRQSLRWFEDDLAIWQERVRVGAPVEEKWLALYLADWGLSDRYTENSLARDLENLSLLPTDEREEWQAFWDKAEAVHASLAKN